MSTTQTAVAESTQSYPLTELNHESPAKDIESPPEQQLYGSQAIDREPATPFLKLIVAGYSFFCAGVGDGTCKHCLSHSLPAVSIARSREVVCSSL